MSEEKRSWVVTMRCTVTKSVVVEDCTEEEARKNPWEYAVDEMEIEQVNWNVERVEPNE